MAWESIAYNCQKLKGNGVIHSTATGDGIFHLKYLVWSRPLIIFHEVKLFEMFPDFALDDDDDKDQFLDA